jgi:hypothetical protein
VYRSIAARDADQRQETAVDQLVPFTPWDSIKQGSVGLAPAELSFADALASPCASCSSSPCCSYLPLQTFTIGNVVDFSYAGYLLNFERIRLGFNRAFEWSAYYVMPCRFLDRDTFACTIHGTDAQPHICRNYNPYSCWYKRSLTDSVSDEFLLVDRTRYEYLTGQVRFDELRQLSSVPSFEALSAAFVELSDPPVTAPEPPFADAAFEGWTSVVLGRPTPEAAAPRRTALAFAEVEEPCQDCSAPCCDTLTFAQQLPTNAAAVDYLRFCLGFPGIEVAVTDAGWWLVVKSPCRHLRDGRCSIFGQPERPLQCRYYEAMKCTYKPEFGQARPPGMVRARLDQFDALVECVQFDEDGFVVDIAPLPVIRERVERQVREAAIAGA